MTKKTRVTPGRVPFTWRKLVTAGAIAACAPAVTAIPFASASAEQIESISWSIQRQSGSTDEIQLTVDSRWGAHSRSNWSNTRRLEELQGLSAAQLMGPSQPVRFALVKEAGRLDCAGTAGAGRGSGQCSYTPNAAFAAYLQAHGIGTPEPHQSYSLTMSGVGRDLVEALDQSGFTRPDIDQLTAMGIHGATASYVRELGGLGYRLSPDDLVAFKIHGVKTDYIRQMATIGPALQHISPSDLVALNIHGVKPEFVREMAAIGPAFRNVSADDLVSMAIHGVRPEMARAYVQLEGGRLNADDVVSMAIHGVTADFLQQMAALGYRNFSADDVVSMAIHGVSSNYLKQLAAIGYRDFSADDLVSMSIHGVTPDYVRRLQQNGMAHLSADQLVRLRLSGFEPNR
ncbi:MAG TPA: hypothetical protein VH392_06875 [Sphingomicrobium sp.]